MHATLNRFMAHPRFSRSAWVSCALGWAMASMPVVAADLDAAARAAELTARDSVACRALGDFHWQIGDGTGVRASGQIGQRVNADTVMPIASASKMIWAAWVLERTGTDPDEAQYAALTMRSGHVGLQPLRCLRAPTVKDCFQRGGNDRFDPASVGRFFYNGGHAQRLAIDMGLADRDNAALSKDLRERLGLSPDLGFTHPSPAGGMQGSARAYGQFLAKVVHGDLRLSRYLGWKPVCTQPGPSCATSQSSPVPAAWHYSLHHWVEDDAAGDGAFSSPGLMGFYPWISADRTTWGVVARHRLSLSAGVSLESVRCGQTIRRAWFSRQAQP